MESKATCSKHPTNNAKYFCFNCNCMICTDCRPNCKDNRHTFECIEDAAHDMVEELRKLAESVSEKQKVKVTELGKKINNFMKKIRQLAKKLEILELEMAHETITKIHEINTTTKIKNELVQLESKNKYAELCKCYANAKRSKFLDTTKPAPQQSSNLQIKILYEKLCNAMIANTSEYIKALSLIISGADRPWEKEKATPGDDAEIADGIAASVYEFIKVGIESFIKVKYNEKVALEKLQKFKDFIKNDEVKLVVVKPEIIESQPKSKVEVLESYEEKKYLKIGKKRNGENLEEIKFNKDLHQHASLGKNEIWKNFANQLDLNTKCIYFSKYYASKYYGKSCCSEICYFVLKEKKFGETGIKPPGWSSIINIALRIFAIGGYKDFITVSEAYEFVESNKSLVSISSMINARAVMGICKTSNSSFCVVGGNFGAIYINKCEEYNIELNKWKPLPDLNVGRGQSGCLLVKSNILYCFGGTNGYVSFDILEKLELSVLSAKWEIVKLSINEAGKNCGPVLFQSEENKIIIFGQNSTAFIYDLANNAIRKFMTIESHNDSFMEPSYVIENTIKVVGRNYLHIYNLETQKYESIKHPF